MLRVRVSDALVGLLAGLGGGDREAAGAGLRKQERQAKGGGEVEVSNEDEGCTRLGLGPSGPTDEITLLAGAEARSFASGALRALRRTYHRGGAADRMLADSSRES